MCTGVQQPKGLLRPLYPKTLLKSSAPVTLNIPDVNTPAPWQSHFQGCIVLGAILCLPVKMNTFSPLQQALFCPDLSKTSCEERALFCWTPLTRGDQRGTRRPRKQDMALQILGCFISLRMKLMGKVLKSFSAAGQWGLPVLSLLCNWWTCTNIYVWEDLSQLTSSLRHMFNVNTGVH